MPTAFATRRGAESRGIRFQRSVTEPARNPNKPRKSGTEASECFGSNGEGSPEAQNEDWPEPHPLPVALPDVQPFNFACLPDTLRPWLADIADRMQCPPDYPAVGAVVALGSLIGRKVGIRPKRHDDWIVVSNLWGMVVGRPGLLKTPAVEQGTAPLNRLVAQANARHQSEINPDKNQLGYLGFSGARS